VTLTSVQTAPEIEVSSAAPLRVALLGCGTVGSEVARLITEQATDLRARSSRPLSSSHCRATAEPGPTRIDPELLTTDAASLVSRDDVDLVIR
jgi:homoserine dehydrogenase